MSEAGLSFETATNRTYIHAHPVLLNTAFPKGIEEKGKNVRTEESVATAAPLMRAITTRRFSARTCVRAGVAAVDSAAAAPAACVSATLPPSLFCIDRFKVFWEGRW